MRSPFGSTNFSIHRICLSVCFLLASGAFATEDGSEQRHWRSSPSLTQQVFRGRGDLPAASSELQDIRKLDIAFGVPLEPPPLEIPSGESWDLSDVDWAKRFRIFDPQKSFQRYMIRSPNSLSVFQDRDHRTVPDFQILKSPATYSTKPALPKTRLPLAGLRIAIDPGHIGSTLWDRRDGKYVQDRRGRVLSEATLALQVALLLEQQLLDLGASVLLTHRKFEPVFRGGSYEKFPLRPFAEVEFRSSRLSEWFLSLLATPGDLVAAAR
ncbi:MAG: hypothetical protein K2X47_15780, partial [Bdellovibrionales bacterium]|nr:hypothetical protein [Bdellovibrionales bacterium]